MSATGIMPVEVMAMVVAVMPTPKIKVKVEQWNRVIVMALVLWVAGDREAVAFIAPAAVVMVPYAHRALLVAGFVRMVRVSLLGHTPRKRAEQQQYRPHISLPHRSYSFCIVVDSVYN